MRYVLWWFLFTTGMAVGTAVAPEPTPQRPADTILVGTGCNNEGGIAVAYEEDQLPTCERIDVHFIEGTR